MISVIGALLDGDAQIAANFKKAKEFWVEFFKEHRGDSLDDLRKAIGDSQWGFEQALGNKSAFAKEIMPLTALGTLYSQTYGFDDREEFAQRVVQAFKGSAVSVEVQGAALRRVVAIYGLTMPI
jgi:hypothetical protein